MKIIALIRMERNKDVNQAERIRTNSSELSKS